MPVAASPPLPRARSGQVRSWLARVPAAVLATVLLAPALLAGVTGCADLADASQGTTRNDLVTDLAAQLARSSALTYAATYQLAGGATATLVQDQQPARSALVYPGGKVTVTADATTDCHSSARALTCTVTAPPTGGAAAGLFTGGTAAGPFTGTGRRGMVGPGTVLDLLTAAALDADVTVAQHDTTVAGRHATCVEVGDATDAPAARFQTCITSEGVLGTFTGQLDGGPVDIALTRFDDTIDATVFDPPSTAKVVDRRH